MSSTRISASQKGNAAAGDINNTENVGVQFNAETIVYQPADSELIGTKDRKALGELVERIGNLRGARMLDQTEPAIWREMADHCGLGLHDKARFKSRYHQLPKRQFHQAKAFLLSLLVKELELVVAASRAQEEPAEKGERWDEQCHSEDTLSGIGELSSYGNFYGFGTFRVTVAHDGDKDGGGNADLTEISFSFDCCSPEIVVARDDYGSVTGFVWRQFGSAERGAMIGMLRFVADELCKTHWELGTKVFWGDGPDDSYWITPSNLLIARNRYQKDTALRRAVKAGKKPDGMSSDWWALYQQISKTAM